jgi:hypothetical protein
MVAAGAPSPRRSSSRIAVARFGIRVWNRNSSIAAISSVDTLTCTRSVRSGVDSVPHALLALVLPGRLAITPPPKNAEKKLCSAKSSSWRDSGPLMFQHACRLGLEGDRLEAPGIALPIWALPRLAQVQEPECPGGKTGGRGRLGVADVVSRN